MRSDNNQNESMFLMEEDNHINRRTLWVLLVGIFLVSFSLLAFEITITRLLPVVLSYHYVFVVISLVLSISEMGHILNRTLLHNQTALTISLRPWL